MLIKKRKKKEKSNLWKEIYLTKNYFNLIYFILWLNVIFSPFNVFV